MLFVLVQVSFISFTILGGIMADFAPVLLLGPVVTWCARVTVYVVDVVPIE